MAEPLSGWAAALDAASKLQDDPAAQSAFITEVNKQAAGTAPVSGDIAHAAIDALVGGADLFRQPLAQPTPVAPKPEAGVKLPGFSATFTVGGQGPTGVGWVVQSIGADGSVTDTDPTSGWVHTWHPDGSRTQTIPGVGTFNIDASGNGTLTGTNPVTGQPATVQNQTTDLLREFVESDPELVLNHALNGLRDGGASNVFVSWFRSNFQDFWGRYLGYVAEQALNGQVPNLSFVDFIMGFNITKEFFREGGAQRGEPSATFASFVNQSGGVRSA